VSWLRRLVVFLLALAGGVAGSQAPEFAQQYRQRLGGAIEELRAIVVRFDEDARRNGLDREEALATYGRAGEPFLRDRGMSMTQVIARFDALLRQRERIEATPPALRPLALLRQPDRRVLEGTWADYRPAVPVGPEGWLWAAVGLLLLGALAALLARLFRPLFRRRPPAPEPLVPPPKPWYD